MPYLIPAFVRLTLIEVAKEDGHSGVSLGKRNGIPMENLRKAGLGGGTGQGGSDGARIRQPGRYIYGHTGSAIGRGPIYGGPRPSA
jgi:hypothetical protein